MKSKLITLLGLGLSTLAQGGQGDSSLPNQAAEVGVVNRQRGSLAREPENGVTPIPAASSPVAQRVDAAGRATSQSNGSVKLVEAGLDQVLTLYAELVGRTVLQWPSLAEVRITVSSGVVSNAEAAALLAGALTNANLAVIPDGNRFVMIVPMVAAGAVRPCSAEIRAVSGDQTDAPVLPGQVNFTAANLDAVMRIYASLVGRKLDPDAARPVASPPIRLRTVNQLTKQEVIYALDTLLAWRGWKMVAIGDELIRPEALLPLR